MKRSLLIAFIALISLTASGQTPVIFDKTTTQTYQLNHTNGGDQSQRIVNDMLEIMARSMNRPIHNMRIHFSIDEHTWLTRNGKKINVYINYEQIRLSGDLFYRGFELSEEMTPSHYSFECALKRKNGPELKRFTIEDTRLNRRNTEHRFEYNDTITDGEYELIVISRDFKYRSQAFDRFRSKCMLIDQYYSSDAEMGACFVALNEINPENFRQLNRTQSQLDEMIIRVGQVQNAPFWRELDIQHFDPINIYPKLDELSHKISDLQANISYVRNNLHKYYFDSGLQSFNSNKRNEARNDFRQANAINNQYPQPIYYLALMEYQDGSPTNAMDLLTSFFSINPIEQSLYGQASELARLVEKAKITEIKKQISGEYYTSSLIALDAVESFCRKIINYTCSDSVIILRGDVHNKVYQKYLYNAQCDLTVTKFDDAIASTNQALQYQSKNSQFIVSNDQAVAMMQKINADYYVALIKRGKSLTTSKDYRNAFSAYDQASNIELNYPVKKDKQLAELTRKAKLEVLFLDVTVAQNLVTSNNLPRAREVLLAIISDQTKYNLKDNTKLNQQVESLKQSIFSKQCMNAQAEYDGVIASANDFIAKGNFISAMNTFEKAKTVAAKNPDCQLNIESANKGVAYTQNPAKYQQDLTAAKRMVDNKDFAKATSAYNNLIAFYVQNKLSDYTSLNHLTLTQFMLQYGPDYILWGASYMANKEDFSAAFTLLESLRQSKASRSKTKNVQKAVANGFALADYNASASVNAKVKVLEYTKGDKWYKYFAKQYQKQIKSFKK